MRISAEGEDPLRKGWRCRCGWKKGIKMGNASMNMIFSKARAKVGDVAERMRCASQQALIRARAKLSDESGQGTTEYAILVGVLVVIAIIAITVFRPKLEELWNAISSGINSL